MQNRFVPLCAIEDKFENSPLVLGATQQCGAVQDTGACIEIQAERMNPVTTTLKAVDDFIRDVLAHLKHYATIVEAIHLSDAVVETALIFWGQVRRISAFAPAI